MSASSRGRDAEWRIRDHLEKQGWIVIRSAASRIIDLIAIKQGEELFIEVKSTGEDSFRISRSKHNKEQLRDHVAYAALIGATPVYAIEFRRTGKWVIADEGLLEIPPIIRAEYGKELETWIP
jgi:Holliday junction resolvase